MKNYTPHKIHYFLVSLTILAAVVGAFFLYADRQELPATIENASKDSAAAYYYKTESTPTSATPIISSAVETKKERRSILTNWEVKGWKLNCAIEPLLNANEKGKVVFKIKINENGRLVAIEHLPNLSNISEEGIQSFKTTLELQLESCLERKNVKIEPISNGTVTFFINKP
jgi:hypothetical protein